MRPRGRLALAESDGDDRERQGQRQADVLRPHGQPERGGRGQEVASAALARDPQAERKRGQQKRRQSEVGHGRSGLLPDLGDQQEDQRCGERRRSSAARLPHGSHDRQRGERGEGNLSGAGEVVGVKRRHQEREPELEVRRGVGRRRIAEDRGDDLQPALGDPGRRHVQVIRERVVEEGGLAKPRPGAQEDERAVSAKTQPTSRTVSGSRSRPPSSGRRASRRVPTASARATAASAASVLRASSRPHAPSVASTTTRTANAQSITRTARRGARLVRRAGGAGDANAGESQQAERKAKHDHVGTAGAERGRLAALAATTVATIRAAPASAAQPANGAGSATAIQATASATVGSAAEASLGDQRGKEGWQRQRQHQPHHPARRGGDDAGNGRRPEEQRLGRCVTAGALPPGDQRQGADGQQKWKRARWPATAPRAPAGAAGWRRPARHRWPSGSAGRRGGWFRRRDLPRFPLSR